MREYLDQITAASQAGLHFIALASAMTVPDMCAAAESHNGETSGAKYQRWFDEWMTPRYTSTVGASRTPFTFFGGRDAWKFRCALLHQGRTDHRDLSHGRVFFVEPAPKRNVHCNIDNGLQLDVSRFVSDMVDCAQAWLTKNADDATVLENLERFVQRYSNATIFGLGGFEVIA